MTDSVPENETSPAPPTAANEQDGAKCQVKWTREHRLAVWANAASFASAGFAAAAFLILLKTLWATQDSLAAAQRQVETAKEANQISSRALAAAIGASVHVEHVEFRTLTEANETAKINILLPIGNDGGTTTRGLSYIATCVDYASLPSDPFNRSRLTAAKMYNLKLSPKETVRPTACSYTIPEWARLTPQQGGLYAYGAAIYQDTINPGTTHYLEFCFRLYDITFTASAFNPGAFAHQADCERHNCADDECKAQ